MKGEVEAKKRRIAELRSRKAARAEKATKERVGQAKEHRLKEAEAKAEELRAFVDSLVNAPTQEEFLQPSGPPLLVTTAPEAPVVTKSVERPIIERTHDVEAYEKGTQTVITSEEEQPEEPPPPPPVVEVVEEETKDEEPEEETTLNEEEMSKFLERSSRLVERCLGERDVFDALREPREYQPEEDEEDISEPMCTETCKFVQAGVLTTARFSPYRKDRILCAYAGSKQKKNYEGRVLLWSLGRPTVAEVELSCQSEVNCATFVDASVIAGGCTTGQLALWDARQPTTLPAQRTPLDAHAPHGRSIVGLLVVEDLIVAASSDGVVSTWSPAQLQRPVDTFVVVEPPKKRRISQPQTSEPAPISALAYVDNAELSGRRFLFGTELGALHSVAVGGSEPDLSLTPHFGLVTAVRPHPAATPGSKLRRDDHRERRRSLVATAGVDWTAAITDLEDNNSVAVLDHGAHAFVADMMWSPTRASLLATATADGDLNIWNLGAVLDHQMHLTKKHSANVTSAALNRIDWSDDGRRLLAADVTGSAFVLSLRDDLARSDPRDDARFDAALLTRRPLAEDETRDPSLDDTNPSE